MTRQPEDDLSRKLRAWKVEAQAPTSFECEIWQRIAQRQAARDEAFWPSLCRFLSAGLTRPAYAVGMAILLLTVGVSFAHREARETNARNWKLLESRYANSLDPMFASRVP